jgi:outer membrane protein assembly factor BamB
MTPVNGSMWVARDDEAGARSFASLDLDDGAYTSGWSACPAAVSMIGSAGAIAVDSNGNSHVATGSTLLMPDSCESTTSTQPIADGTGAAVVPGTSSVAVVGGGNLVLFDSAARAVKWSVPESGTTAIDGSPAIVGETIYVHNNGSVQLEARRVSDGEVLWSWSPPWTDDFALQGNVVATDNLVFVSTTRRVYAIDLATHKAVWVYPYPGRLAISANGILFVLRSSIGVRSLAAINLH